MNLNIVAISFAGGDSQLSIYREVKNRFEYLFRIKLHDIQKID